MAITHLGNNRYEGLTADTKPTNVPAGSRFRDTQLDIEYEYSGSLWEFISGNINRYQEYRYHIYIDAVDNIYKAFNTRTNIVEFVGNTTDALSVLNSVIAACHTVREPFFISKGLYLISAKPSVPGKYLHAKGMRTGGYEAQEEGNQVRKRFRCNYSNPSGIFIDWDASTMWCKQQWETLVIEGRNTGTEAVPVWSNEGIGMQITNISEVWDATKDVMIRHFATAFKLLSAWEMAFHNLVIYNCTQYGIHITDNPPRNKSFECKFWGGEIRSVPIDVFIENGNHCAFTNFLCEGFDGAPYTSVNMVKLGSNANNTRFYGCSFENPVDGIVAILDDGFLNTIQSCRFGGNFWTAQTIYQGNVANGCSVVDNTIEPYALNAVATILLSAGCRNMTVRNNKVGEGGAGGASLVVTDVSGYPLTHDIWNNHSGQNPLPNYVGPATTFRSVLTALSGLAVSGGANISSAVIGGNTTIGGTLGVTGITTLSARLDVLIPPVTGFENIAKFGLTGTTDVLTIDNAINSAGHFAPIMRADARLVGFPSTAETFHLQAIINPDNDIGTTAILVLATLNRLIVTPFTQTAITSVTKPLIAFRNLATDYARFYTNRFWLADAKDIEVGTTTGTKIGTLPTQKLGFYGQAPRVQQTLISSPAADLTGLKTAVDAIRTWMIAQGFMSAT